MAFLLLRRVFFDNVVLFALVLIPRLYSWLSYES